jgi:septum formation protein
VQPLVVLASASPRRAHILRALGIPFRTVVSSVDETVHPGEDGLAAAERLARAKAADVSRRETLPVLAADTLVVCEGKVLGKPSSSDEAAQMLRCLAGQQHVVVTGVCVQVGEQVFSGVETSTVSFATMSDDEIAWYVGSGEPSDKAGAYHIDGRGGLFVTSVEGSPSNVAGLPVRLVWQLAREAGIDLGWPR